MRFSPKPIFKAIGTFIRRNDTKILKIASYGAIALGTGLVVKGSIEAGAEIQERETELKIEQQDPNVKLSKTDKAKIIARKVLPGGAMIIGGTVINEVCFRILNKRIIVATAVSEYATAKSLFNTSANNEQKDEQNGDNNETKCEIIIPKELDTFDKVEFDVFEPISGQTIHHVTVRKLAMSEFSLNFFLRTEGQLYLDTYVGMLGGHILHPAYRHKYLWQMKPEYTDCGLFPMSAPWVSLIPTIDGDRMIIRFSDLPYCLGESRYVEAYGKDV